MKLFFACDHDIELLPHFLRHYICLGFTHFFCSGTNAPQEIMKVALATFNLFDLELEFNHVPHYQEAKLPYFRSLQAAFASMVHDNVGEREWYGLSELDEFHQYPISPAKLAQECEAGSWDVVLGILVDRVAADGGLPPLRSDVSLEQQFPATSKISEQILQGCADKVMLLRGRREIHGGNHSTAWPYRYWPEKFVVNHFKWSANILKRMQERVLMDDEGFGWREGNKRVLKHWNEHGSVLI